MIRYKFMYIGLLCAILSSIGCISSSLIGEYRSQDASEYLLLKKDSTFQYKIDAHMLNRQTEGKWKRINNELFLKSFDSLRYFNVTERDSFNLKSVLFIIKDIDGYGADGCYIYLDNDSSRRFDFPKNGILTIPSTSNTFKSFTIFSPLRYEAYKRVSTQSNAFSISFEFSSDVEKWYIDEQFSIKGKKLFSKKYQELIFRLLN